MELDNGEGVVIFAHGSSVPSANAAVERVAADAAARGGFGVYETAFLDVEPTLKTATERLLARGVRRVFVVPYFLTLGIHLQRDLPALVQELEAAHPGLEMRVAPPLDGHPGLSAILAERARELLAQG